MKRLLFALITLLALTVQGANPSFQDITNNVSTTNLTLLTNLVANLGSASPAGQMKYASDVITPSGVGDVAVFSDGTNWRLNNSRIIATTSIPAFILNGLEAVANYSSRLSTIYTCSDEASSSLAGFPLLGSNGGTGSTGSGTQGSSYSFGMFGALFTGTTTTGWGATFSFQASALQSGDFLSCGAAVFVGTLNNGIETYWCTIGNASASSAASSVFPTSGTFFLYDASNTSGLTGTSASTNNWWAINAKASSYTATDTGLPVSTSITTPNRLAVIATTTNTLFYTNGVLSVSSSANIPTVLLYPMLSQIVKTAGTTTRQFAEAMPWIHYRRATQRTVP